MKRFPRDVASRIPARTEILPAWILPAGVLLAWFLSWPTVADVATAQSAEPSQTSAFAPAAIARGTPNAPTISTGPLLDATRFSLPTPGVTPAGFQIEVMHGGLNRFGELPVRVVVSPTGPTFREDGELTVRVAFDVGSVRPAGRANNYQFSIKIGQGASLVDKTVYLPKWFFGGTLRFSVLQAGQPLPGYTVESMARPIGAFGPSPGPDALQSYWLDSAVGRFGWIAGPDSKTLRSAQSGEDIEDIRVLMVSLVPELAVLEPMARRDSVLSTLKSYGELAGIAYRTVDELPDQWLGFGQCHVWVTRWETWQWLVANRPQVAMAMRENIRCGGALWIVETPAIDEVASAFDVTGAKWAVDTEELDQLAEPIAPAASAASPTDSPARLMERERRLNAGPTAGSQDGPVGYPMPSLNTVITRGYSGVPLHPRRVLFEATVGLARSVDNASWVANQQWLDSFRVDVNRSDVETIPIGAGVVVCCGTPTSMPGSFDQWRHMHERTGSSLSSVINRGVDPINGDNRFWNWVIPGVAQPPVYGFLTLLTGFVILVGPVAYRKLNRIGRSYLMFFVAPALAAITTIVLFAYGVLADGLGTQARIRQVTWLCEDGGGAMRYWRSTYFAGLRPADGLRFPASARVEPYWLNQFGDWSQMLPSETGVVGNVTLTDQSLSLGTSFLPSRQQRQFAAYRPLDDAGGLTVSKSDTTSSVTVKSDFEYELRELVVRDKDGGYWTVDSIAAGQTAVAKVLDDRDASIKLGELYVRQMPTAPAGVVRQPRSSGTWTDLVTALAASDPFRETPNAARAGSGDSEVEWWLRKHLQTGSRLPRSTYIATADVTDDCVAAKKTRLVESIHYVIGTVR